MVQMHFVRNEAIYKIVYAGLPLSGRTTNIRKIYENVAPDQRNQLTSINTDSQQGRIFFLILYPLIGIKLLGCLLDSNYVLL